MNKLPLVLMLLLVPVDGWAYENELFWVNGVNKCVYDDEGGQGYMAAMDWCAGKSDYLPCNKGVFLEGKQPGWNCDAFHYDGRTWKEHGYDGRKR